VIICKVCGTQNEAGATFCGSCGSYLEWSGETFNADGTPAAPGTGVAGPGGDPGPAPAPVPGPGVEPAQPSAPAPMPTPAPVGPPAEQAPAGGIVCPVCGETNDPTRTFCRRCATELAPPAPIVEAVTPEPPRRRSGPPVAILGGIAAVAALAIVAAVVVLPKGTATPSSGTGTAAPSSSVPGTPGSSPSAGSSSEVPTATTPAPATPTGEVVFAASRDGDFDLWIWDAPTGQVRSLLAAPGNQSEPSWSPDRSRVVYRDPVGLRMILADGTPADPPDFTHHAQDLNPAWSPDGSTIAFATNRAPLTSLDIYARPADDNQVVITPLANSKADDWDPAWTPDGSRIVFVSKRLGDAHLFVMNADGSDETEIDLGPGIYDDPAVSPDGQWLAFTRRENKDANKALYVARLDGSEMRRLTNSDVNEHDMTWSPDSRYIAVVRGDAGARIVVIELETGAEASTFGVDGARAYTPDWR
jgi:dipeptidyl aminopeptidase/acylaminoacyl peptidase/ribosomal protein L40E